MNIKLIGVECDFGCPNKGTAESYAALCQCGIKNKFPSISSSEKVTENPSEKMILSTIENLNINNKSRVLSTCKNLNLALMKTFSNGDFPFVIGGDHSLGLGSISAFAQAFGTENIAVIWVDAHTDIHRVNTSSSHNIHGMPLGIATDCKGVNSNSSDVAKIVSELPLPWLQSRNLHIVGARSIDEPEMQILKNENANLYTIYDMRKLGFSRILSQIKDRVKGKKVLISFDVDVLDGELFKATGLPVSDGFTPKEAADIITFLIENTDTGYFDCVEYSPFHDKRYSDGRGMQVLLEILGQVSIAIEKGCLI